MVIPDVTVPTDTALAEQSLLQVVFQLQHFKTNVYLVSNKLEVWGGRGQRRLGSYLSSRRTTKDSSRDALSSTRSIKGAVLSAGRHCRSWVLWAVEKTVIAYRVSGK